LPLASNGHVRQCRGVAARLVSALNRLKHQPILAEQRVK
jgi:hypothetical protein